MYYKKPKSLTKKKDNNCVKKLKGQITIFMALSFFVVFTLFSMTVSLSMFIHDKINIQNATDLASYYVASKQAELLGAIAHNNYAIRQSFKLLSYRYRVYGNASRTANGIRNPGIEFGWQGLRGNRDPYTPATIGNGPQGPIPPRVCIGAGHLISDIGGDNYCSTLSFNVGYLEGVSSILGGLIGGLLGDVDSANLNIATNCENVAYLNWYYANSIVGAHKYEQQSRRHVINEIAQNLARPIVAGADGMRDIEGGNIFDGAYKTFTHNLTESNREYLQGNRNVLTVANSMAGISPSDWLNPVYINVLIPYSAFSTAGGGCSEVVRNHTIQAVPRTQNLITRLDPNTQIAVFGGYPPNASDDQFEVLSLGVEKNPWYMVYNKVDAFSFSKPLFLGSFISNDGIRVAGRSYAKPFGGRIGPWYESLWPQGSVQSNGGERTDAKTPNRVTIGEYGTNRTSTDPTVYPNYSRFPTDQNGLTTNEAMVHAGPLVAWNYISGVGGQIPPTSIQDYHFVTHSYQSTESYSDPLIQDVSRDEGVDRTDSFNRRMEIAAIVPDAFDITYYSISPNYYDYFIEENGVQKLSSWITEPNNKPLRGDIGAFEENKRFSILNQLSNYSIEGGKDIPVTIAPFNINRSADQVPYFLNSSTNFAMLTSWNKGREPMSYLSPTDGVMDAFFARCVTPTDATAGTNKPRQPSGCLQGGRFGYSVKLISSDYLQGEHPIGGNGTTGSLENGDL